MKQHLYVRGNGAKVLKKRFQAFDKIFIMTLFAFILGLYVIMQSQIKSVTKETGDLTVQKKLLTEELDRLMSDYDKMITYSELKQYANTRLDMAESASKIKSFTVIDKYEVFRTVKTSEMPDLFETKISLALLRQDEIIKDR
jgi:cell division protein FtsL